MFSKMRSFSLLFLVCCAASVNAEENFNDEVYPQPEQIHLSLAADETQMMVTWVTQSPTSLSVVEYGPQKAGGVKFTRRAYGNVTLYEDFGLERRKSYNHRVLLKNLTPGFSYYYHCGDPVSGWSAIYWFKALSEDPTFDPVLLIYGDMGNKKARAVAHLQNEVQKSNVDAILHVGDLAYDMADDNGRRGDEFMRQIEPIAAYVPYQVCPGNHEHHYNFSNYDARFSMYNAQQKAMNNYYYSFNIGPVHVVSISTEFYFFHQFGYEQIKYQYDWLLQDLTEANKKENREKRPWIFLMGHRPMYCTNIGDFDCTNINSITRTGMLFTHDYALEPLLKKFGVDMFWCGHQHSYERLWPVFNGTVGNTKAKPYVDPSGPVHIITGSPGSEEGLNPFGHDPLKVSAFHSAQHYTYTRLHVKNKTHIFLDQIAVPSDKTIDHITLEKSSAYPIWQTPDMAVDASVVLD